jgi:hypothetical protein
MLDVVRAREPVARDRRRSQQKLSGDKNARSAQHKPQRGPQPRSPATEPAQELTRNTMTNTRISRVLVRPALNHGCDRLCSGAGFSMCVFCLSLGTSEICAGTFAVP